MFNKINLSVFGIVVAVGIILRSFMLSFTVETTSGFIKSEYMPWAVFIIALLTISAAFVFFIAFFGKQKNTLPFKTTTLIYSIAEIIMAVAMLNEAFFSSLLKYAQPTQIILHKLAAVLSAAGLLYIAGSKLFGKEYSKHATILPITFFITRIIVVFSEFAALATVSDTVIETICMCLALVTFLNFAKISCGINLKNVTLCKSVAMLCCFACAVGSIPRIICLLMNTTSFEYFSNIPIFTTFAAAIFSFSVAFKCEE
ncbi:MAG: hypothetical protein IIX54_01240 [Clostridia bacterium]|nr:hypothetical protein [Clostridia bacterium]